MEILDAQVHTWLSDRPRRPWSSGYRPSYMARQNMLLHAGQTMTPDQVVLEMAEAGVDGGLLSPVGVYGTSNDLELCAAEQYPRKFGVIGYIDHLAEDVEERLSADAARGMLGVRVLSLRDEAALKRGDFDRLLRACQDLDLSVSFMLSHPHIAPAIELVTSHPHLLFVIDHLGMSAVPPTLGPTPPNPFAELDVLLGLAAIPNVIVKLTGAVSLSHESYPFRDIWDPVVQIVRTFGADRVMWGTDFTRVSGLHSYWDGTHYLAEIDELASEELELLYGQTLRARMGWVDQPHVRPPLDSRIRP